MTPQDNCTLDHPSATPRWDFSTSAPRAYQMDLGGVIQLLSRNLYSGGPEVIPREFLQNAADAHTARRNIEPGHIGWTDIELTPLTEDSGMLCIADNGLGIAPEEIERSLGTIALSLKREQRRTIAGDGIIGCFGVGLLSGFIGSDTIDLVSRKATPGSVAFRWTGHREGHWVVHPVEADLEPGTRVTLKLEGAAYRRLRAEILPQLVRKFGELLPDPITVHGPGFEERITRKPFWEGSPTEEDLLTLGRELGMGDALGAFRFQCPEAAAEGVVYVAKHRATPGSEPLHRLYVRRMFVTDHARKVAPEGYPFLRCLLNSDNLQINAAREDLHGEEERLTLVRDAVRHAFTAYLQRLDTEDPSRLFNIIATHAECFVTEAQATGAHLDLLRHHLPITSTQGSTTVDAALKRFGKVWFTSDDQDYLRIELKAAQEGLCVAQGHYHIQGMLLRLLQQHLGSNLICQTTAAEFLAQFRCEEAVHGPREAHFLKVAGRELELERCLVELEEADDPYSPAALHMDDMDSILRSFSASTAAEDDEAPSAKRLVFNRAHVVVESLIDSPDLPDYLVRAWVRSFYHHALLSSRERPTAGENRRHSKALTSLWKASTSFDL